ncbi:hypothetical protein LCGC14_1409880 [marine sediment metagenome]|uniref:Uncharacterized protein n=1 Tax=marine sediment metagenome TaxID=412755 RepID=A0A0F9MW77_9ZZZZ
MKRKRQPRKKKLKPHETMDGLKGLVEKNMWGHKVEWRKEGAYESIGVCTLCNAVVVIVLRPLGIENVYVGDVVNKECPNRQKEKE